MKNADKKTFRCRRPRLYDRFNVAITDKSTCRTRACVLTQCTVRPYYYELIVYSNIIGYRSVTITHHKTPIAVYLSARAARFYSNAAVTETQRTHTHTPCVCVCARSYTDVDDAIARHPFQFATIQCCPINIILLCLDPTDGRYNQTANAIGMAPR